MIGLIKFYYFPVFVINSVHVESEFMSAKSLNLGIGIWVTKRFYLVGLFE